jgi:hypothetical protein
LAGWTAYRQFAWPVVIASDVMAAGWSKDGSAVFYGVGDSIYRYDVRHRRRTRYRLPAGLAEKWRPEVSPNDPPLRTLADLDASPDGQRVAFMVDEASGQNHRIYCYVMDLESRTVRPLDMGGNTDTDSLMWLSNGLIAYGKSRRPNFSVWLMRPDGTERRLLGRDISIGVRAGDGSGFLDGGAWRVYRAATDGFTTVRVPWKFDKEDPTPPPELVFLSSRHIAFGLYNTFPKSIHLLIDIDSGKVRPIQLPAPGYDHSIAPDGKHILYSAGGVDGPKRLCVDALTDDAAAALTGPWD